MGFSDPLCNALLDAIARAVPFSVAGLWVQLHIGDPLADGSGSPAVNSARHQAAFAAAAAIRSIANTAEVTWTNAPATETYTHVSVWSASTAGLFVGSAEISSPQETPTGEVATVPIGSLVLTL